MSLFLSLLISLTPADIGDWSGVEHVPGNGPNWDPYADPLTTFPAGFRGWKRQHPDSQRIAETILTDDAADEFDRHIRTQIPALRFPVLAVESGAGGAVLLTTKHALPYFGAHIRRCPTCFEFEAITGDLLNRVRIAIDADPEARGYDTLIRYRRPYTWDEIERPAELADLYAATANVREVAALLLRVDQLEFRRVILPAAAGDPWDTGPPPIPDWVRVIYAGPTGRPARDEWIRAGWGEIQRRAPGESWLEFYRENGFLPGDRSVQDMLYTFQLRHSLSREEHLRRERVVGYPTDPALHGGRQTLNALSNLGADSLIQILAADDTEERRRQYRDTFDAMTTADRWLGVQRTYPDPLESALRDATGETPKFLRKVLTP